MVVEMDIIWLLIVGIFIAVLASLVLKDISDGLAGLAAFIAVIMLIAIISISGSEKEKAIMKKDIEDKGIENVVIDLYAYDINVKEIADKVGLTSKEVYKILKDNDIL